MRMIEKSEGGQIQQNDVITANGLRKNLKYVASHLKGLDEINLNS